MLDFSIMAVNLGQVAAVLYGTTAPSNTNVIWAKTSTNDPNTWVIQDFRRYDGSTWISLSAVHYAASAPTDTTKVWLDTSANPPIIKTHNGSSWLEINRLRSAIKTADYSIIIDDNNASINVESASDVSLTLDDPGSDEFACTVSRLGTGAVNIVPVAGVLINGVNGSVAINAQWRSVLIRKIRTNEFLIEGAL